MRMRTLAAIAAGLAAPVFAQVQQVDGALRDSIAQELELADFTVQRLALPAENVAFDTEVTLGNVTYDVWVEPRSFRTAGATATAVGADGIPRQIPMPAPLTVRAELDGAPEASAAGSRYGGGLSLAIFIPGGELHTVWTVQPLTDVMPDADPALHVVYRDSDVAIKELHECGVIDHVDGMAMEAQADGGGSGSRSLLICELATEADWEYYVSNGQSENNTIADIDLIIARVSAVYEGQCNVALVIPHYNIWTASNDPYTSTDSGTRLGQFRSWWNQNKGDVNRDLAHMFTDVNLNGSVIGIAYLSAVCGSNGYGLVESKFTSGQNSRGALSAHEIGHNFSSQHCDGNGDCHIMCSGLGGCDRLGNPAYFGQSSATKITNYAANRPCLTDGGGLVYPFFEEWTETTISDLVWPLNNGGVVNSDADNEPSAPYALNLDGADSIESGSLDLTGVLETPYFSFHSQHKGVENGKTLIAEYRDINGVWQQFETLTSDGANQSTFSYHVYPIDVFAWGTDFAVRFRAMGGDGTDDWYIDNIAIGPFSGNAVPFHEPFADSTFNTGTSWDTIAGAQVSTAADNEPSDPYSMNLDGSDSATTFNFLMAAAPFPTYLSFYTQHKGVENGESLVVEYINDFGGWSEFATITSNGTDQSSFSFHQDFLLIDAFHDAFAIRFRAVGSDSTDDWYIDDIRLGDEFSPPDDCVADFNGDGTVNTQDVLLFLNAWNAGDSSADINGDGVINTQDVLMYLNLWNAGCP